MSIENILITGATGFLGQRLAARLKAQGHRVTAIGRNNDTGRRLEQQGIEFISADLADADAISGLCQNKSYVFHCGALSAPWGKYGDFYRTNVLGVRHIIAGCQRYGVARLIHVSTASVYSELRDKISLAEDSPLPGRMINYYAETKLLAEVEINKAFRTGLPVVMLRPSGIFGPGDTALLPRLIRANNKGCIPVIAGKRVMTDITYVENVVDALVLCMTSGAHVLGKIYNITNGEPIALHAFLADLMVRLGYRYRSKDVPFFLAWGLAHLMETFSRLAFSYREPVLTRYAVGILAYSRTLDISAARKDLGYSPRVSIEEGVNAVVNEWNKNHACCR